MSVPGFNSERFELLGKPREVYRRGRGPAVIVLSEIPGITPEVARFSRRVADAGFSVFMPQLFGTPMAPLTSARSAAVIARVCIRREIHVLSSNQSSPVVDWLRALARRAHELCGGPGVGVVGMCITGNFGLAMMLDAPVIAPVLAQPSLPGGPTAAQRAALHASPQEIAAAREKIAHQGARILGLRFKGDPFCRAARFKTLRDTFGPAFEAIELDSRCGKQGTPLPPHSMLTTHLIDEAGQPTRQALERTLAFLAEQLKRPGPA